ncbi:rhomboid-like protein [Mycobacterium terramassiliense]|nr:rhomboid-like protein [Mycobacterium terramassiliense]
MAAIAVRETTASWAARALSRAASVRVTAAYAVALAAISVMLKALGPHARDVVVSRMSTNLHNLAHGRLTTLVGSAFVDDGGEVYLWLPWLVCLLALGELLWRGKGLVVTFAVGHIGATLLVALGLVVALEAGWLPSSIARASDVGVSYGAVCVLGALTASVPSRWRAAWAGWWLGIAVTVALGADFTAVGHVLALLLGIGLSYRLPSAAAWTPSRIVLLCGGCAFGYFVLSGSSVEATATGLAAALIGLLAGRASRPQPSPA